MFKYIVLFAALLVFAAAKPLVFEYPVAAGAAYTAPAAVAYTAPLAYSSAYSAYSPLAYTYSGYPSYYYI